MLMAVQQSVPAVLPPVFKAWPLWMPPQMIISLPVHTAVWMYRAVGAFALQIAVQLSAKGLYAPPLLKSLAPSFPPQTIISLPVHTAV
jgi:hypothetical protein